MSPLHYIQSSREAPTPAPPPPLSADDQSKDLFFVRLGELAEEMVSCHGKDFTMGALLLSARFIAENKPLVHRDSKTEP